MENLELLKSIANMIKYMSIFYTEEQKIKSKDTRIFKAQDNSFLEGKLNPLSEHMIKILDFYMNNIRGINMR
jgi:hypothetical protein